MITERERDLVLCLFIKSVIHCLSSTKPRLNVTLFQSVQHNEKNIPLLNRDPPRRAEEDGSDNRQDTQKPSRHEFLGLDIAKGEHDTKHARRDEG